MAFTRHEREGIVYFTIPSFDDTGLARNCFTTRVGGVSSGRVKGLNLGFSRPDSRENVNENFRRLCRAVGIDSESLVFSNQVHGTHVREVTAQDAGKGIWRDSDIKNTDGLITSSRGVTLTTFYADCVPLYFLDPVKRVAGLAHAGWRGTVAGIALETVKRMNEAFGSRPEDMLVGIGPSICRDCYEVDEPVVSRLKENIGSWRDVITPLGKGKFLLDLQLTNRIVLQKAGIREENITDSGLCTMCNGELFYSYRREGKDTGSLAALLQLA
ncbi:MAG TPA: peptidoglycan editing factor PgeF [Bacillota bacterium]|jgi:YfiH family protein|nr:peptidoglycan editing factor PgeF [Bacillota bacterium]